MAIMVLLEARARADAVERVGAALPALIPVTRAYDECRGITAYTCADDGQIVVVEYGETRAHYERDLASRTDTGVIASLVSMLQSEPRIRHVETVEA